MTALQITDDLIEYLQKVFTDTLPEQPLPLDQLGVLIGQQKVIRHLQAQHKAQALRGALLTDRVAGKAGR